MEGPKLPLRIRKDIYRQALAKGVAKRVGRNSPCPCGSGKKFKKCCRLIFSVRR